MLAKIEPKRKSALPHLPFYIPLFNHMIRALLRAGVPLGYVGLLTVKGRISGKTRRNPVGFFDYNRHLYLFSTFGDVNWVRNLRASRYATVRRGLHSRRVNPVELSPNDAAIVLKGAVAPAFQGPGGKIFGSHFPLKPDQPIDVFVQEANRHPVFELREAA